jgi:hypothetical protein
MLHAEKESGAEISPFQPNMVAMSVLKNSLNPATSNPALVSLTRKFLELPIFLVRITWLENFHLELRDFAHLDSHGISRWAPH